MLETNDLIVLGGGRAANLAIPATQATGIPATSRFPRIEVDSDKKMLPFVLFRQG